MRYSKIENTFFKQNRTQLCEKLKANSIAILNSNDEMPRNGDQSFPYRQSSDFFYFTGIEQEQSILILCPNHHDKNYRELLFIERPEKTKERWYGYRLSKKEAQDISGIDTIKYLDEFESISRNLILFSENIYLNINEFAKYSTEVESRDFRFLNGLKKSFPLHEYERLAPHITNLRLIKKSVEIDLMQKAIEITNKAFKRVLKFTKPETLEYEIEAELTHEFIRNGANGHAYAPIVAAGKNGLVLHYIKNNQKCKDGELVLMDFGAEYANYSADCTRTFPANGKFTPRQKEVYEAVLRVLKKAKNLLIPGTIIDEYNKKIKDLMAQECVGLGLFSQDELNNQDPDNPLVMKYFMHGTSHFMGLDVHDVGSYYKPLEKGMVLSCEPALYIDDENIAIRLENDILVDDIPIDLMQEIPIEIDDIENFMNE